MSKEYLESTDLRVEIMRFCKELLRSDRRTVGRLDGRFKGLDEFARSERPDFDPSMAAIRPPYTAARVKSNITEAYYEAGHMMYIDVRELARLKKDVNAFVADTLRKRTGQPTTPQQ